MKEIKKAMYGKGYVWKILYVLYAMAIILNIYSFIKSKNIAYIEIIFWIFNTTIMFACARMNEKRADKFQKLYFDETENNLEEKVDKFMKEIKNEQGIKDKID